MQPIGHPLVVTAMLVATTIAVAIADEDDSDSDENLRQALVLVDILKSAILRRSQRRFVAKPSSLAGYAERPWPPPYETPFSRYGLPFRRMNNEDDDAGRRKDNNITRQMDYEDPYGPPPGGDGPSTPGEATEGSTRPEANNQNKDTSTVTAKMTETTDVEIKTKSINEIQSSSPLDNTAKNTMAATKKTIATENYTQKEKLSGTPKKFGTTTIQSLTKIKTKKPKKLITKLKKTNRENFKTTTKVPTSNSGGIIMLKYNKKSRDRDVIDSKRADEAEIAEAAMELQREAGDIVQRRCAARRTHSRPGRTGNQSSENEPQTSCVSPQCKEGNATQVTTLRYKATTRIYLSRSVRPQIPLPANNAFCYTNPENALCRTMI